MLGHGHGSIGSDWFIEHIKGLLHVPHHSNHNYAFVSMTSFESGLVVGMLYVLVSFDKDDGISSSMCHMPISHSRGIDFFHVINSISVLNSSMSVS